MQTIIQESNIRVAFRVERVDMDVSCIAREKEKLELPAVEGKLNNSDVDWN